MTAKHSEQFYYQEKFVEHQMTKQNVLENRNLARTAIMVIDVVSI